MRTIVWNKGVPEDRCEYISHVKPLWTPILEHRSPRDVMEGVTVRVAVKVGGGGVDVRVAVGVDGSKTNPLHPASSAAKSTMMDIRWFIFFLLQEQAGHCTPIRPVKLLVHETLISGDCSGLCSFNVSSLPKLAPQRSEGTHLGRDRG